MVAIFAQKQKKKKYIILILLQSQMIKEDPTTKIHYCLETTSLFLRPYCKKYVKQYHEWFTLDPELLHQTGSEPLTLQQQYENHKSWIQDQKKYTFLVFLKEEEIMIGDVNLFFSDWIEQNQAEINIMIARKQYRGKGYAKQIMEAIEMFARGIYNKSNIIAKIKNDNIASIKFFEKMNYQLICDNEHFQEKQLHKKIKVSQAEAKSKLESELFIKEYTDKKALYKLQKQ